MIEVYAAFVYGLLIGGCFGACIGSWITEIVYASLLHEYRALCESKEDSNE